MEEIFGMKLTICYCLYQYPLLGLLQVSLLGRLHHRNLVNLLGYCIDKGSHMLIYEFMSNGSLDNLLYGKFEAHR